MINEEILIRDKPVVVFVVPSQQSGTRSGDKRQAILEVLERAADDDRFLAQLTYLGAEALEEYSLGLEAQAALLSGDLSWLESRVGELDGRLSTWPLCRLEQEIW